MTRGSSPVSWRGVPIGARPGVSGTRKIATRPVARNRKNARCLPSGEICSPLSWRRSWNGWKPPDRHQYRWKTWARYIRSLFRRKARLPSSAPRRSRKWMRCVSYTNDSARLVRNPGDRSPQAVIVLHERALILISAPAIALVSAAELPALAAHEIGHEYVWIEWHRARQRADRARLKELELVCDAIAAVTLRQLGMDPSKVIDGVEKVTRFNRERFGSATNEESYPTLAERRAFASRNRSMAAGLELAFSLGPRTKLSRVRESWSTPRAWASAQHHKAPVRLPSAIPASPPSRAAVRSAT